MSGAALDPHLAWARSGAMALAGHAGGMPRLAPGPLAVFASAAVAELASASGSAALRELDGAALLGERAAVAGLARRGRVSPGGSCRILATRDGWLALNLARLDDVRLLPAWLECDPDVLVGDPWPAVEERCRARRNAGLVERARLLGLPAADASPLTEEGDAPLAPHRIAARGPRREAGGALRVLDLSSLWAGPLCAHLLGLAGAQVVKVESRARPDGARRGPRAFFDLLNGGKRSAVVDLGGEDGRRALRRLIASSDVVVESARPRALGQLGIDAAQCVAEMPGLVWVSITGYGRRHGGVAFGDDAACAAGLAAAAGDERGPLFCGDAIADPLTGIHAARAAWRARARGGGVLLDVALCDVVRLARAGAVGEAQIRRDGCAWHVESGAGCAEVAAPRRRPVRAAARSPGADNGTVLC